MPLTANTLYRDSFNFFRNHLISITLLSLLIALIAMLLNQSILPDLSPLGASSLQDLLKNMAQVSSDQQLVGEMEKIFTEPQNRTLFFKAVLLSGMIKIITAAILIASILTLLMQISRGQRFSTLQILGASSYRLPRLLLLIVACFAILLTMMVIVATLAQSLPMIINVLLVSLLLLGYYFTLSLSPIILLTDTAGIFSAMKQSVQISLKIPLLILPVLLLWMVFELPLSLVEHMLLTTLHNSELSTLLSLTLANLLSSWVLIYLFRLYMLLKKSHTDS